MPVLRPRPPRPRRPAPRLAFARLAAAACCLAAAAGCIPITNSYPAVERADVLPLAVNGSDTAWVLDRTPFTVVGSTRATLELPGGLTGVARGWERMFGTTPGLATIVLVEVSPRERVAVPPPLPDSLAARTVVWVPTRAFDDGERERREGTPVAGTPVMMGGAGGSAALQLAQAWLDARIGGAGNVPIPPWLRAGLVEALGGNDLGPGVPRALRDDIQRLSLDTLLARRCPADWAPIPRWRPYRPAADSAADPAANRPFWTHGSEGVRAFEENMKSACGLALRIGAASFVRFLLDRGGDALAATLVRTYLAGGTLEQAIRGQANLPQSTVELERAWRGWEAQRIQDLRMQRAGD